MAYNEIYNGLAHNRIPPEWLESRLASIVAAHDKIKHLYWVRWEGGYKWKFGANRPRAASPYGEWENPTLEQTIERQCIFDGRHLTTRKP